MGSSLNFEDKKKLLRTENESIIDYQFHWGMSSDWSI